VKKLIAVIGATGVGKTARAIELAKQYACPIISADSRQIYRDLPIGTAAPTAEEQSEVRHYLVGFKSLEETYNAGQFARDAKILLNELFQEYDHVILVGGSMMYVEALCRGLDDIPEVSSEIRTSVRESYHREGLSWLQSEVERLDPTYWQEVDQHNPQRLMHCIEVCLSSGKPYSSFRRKWHNSNIGIAREWEVEYVMVELPREELYERINLRVDKMIESGLLDEARKAFESVGMNAGNGYQTDNGEIPNSLNTVGYKELLFYFRGEWTINKAIDMIKQNSRHYAKRQMTWWRNRGIKSEKI
jgi:tRNA dimethylallyltransferase